MFLLGAGASKNAGVPIASEMTKRIIGTFDPDSPEYRVLTFVTGGLLFKEGQAGRNPIAAGVNVEELFNAVQLLAGRHQLEASPFVGSWHQMVDQLDRKTRQHRASGISRAIFRAVWSEISSTIPSRARGVAEDRVNRAIIGVVTGIAKRGQYTSGGYGSVGHAISETIQGYLKEWTDQLRHRTHGNFDIDRAVEEAIEGRRDLSGEGEIFNETGRKMIAALRELVWIKTGEKVDYLKPILNLLADQPRLVIATLNYDNAIELLTHKSGVRCVTGIESWENTQRIQCDGDGVVLLKLHGSIDWRYKQLVPSPDRPLLAKSLERVPDDQVPHNGAPAVIFGQRNKLTAEGPFLDILREFKIALDASTRLAVIGYSFADAHVNEYVARWINSSPKRVLRIVTPDFEKNQNDFAVMLRRQCPSRLQIVPGRAEDVLEELCRAGQTHIPYG
jgi:hypothetical protein